MSPTPKRQSGTSLIEVLVAVLILSFGMLALGGMLAYSVQMPKLSAYRAAASSLAAGHVERMRANVDGFTGANYIENNTYNATLSTSACAYPTCTASTIALQDKSESNAAIRAELPLGGMRVTCDGTCAERSGDIWIMWQEPASFSSLNAANTDECPDGITFTVQPRCLHLKFQL